MQKILIIDFGSQFTQLIGRKLRELNQFSEIVSPENWEGKFSQSDTIGIILSGGPSSVYEEGAPGISARVFTRGVPVLGICYGMQLMVQSLGGHVRAMVEREYGEQKLHVDDFRNIFNGAGWDVGRKVLMSHGDEVVMLPPGFTTMASTHSCRHAAIADPERRFFAVQFHPEVTRTDGGQDILASFLDICGSDLQWQTLNIKENIISEMRSALGDKKVLCALSGGVDSAVTAAILHEAIGPQLYCVMVDTGLLRAGEVQEVKSAFDGRFHNPLVVHDASELFFDALKGISDPEAKRKAIGAAFIVSFENALVSMKESGVEYLAQGTLYPDVIESTNVAGKSSKIKSHHNVGGLPAKLGFKIVEPFRWLFKDEVRRIGAALGLPSEIVNRQPFPGPGLGIRVVGPVDRESVEITKAADKIVREEFARHPINRDLWQVYAALLPVRTVGVMGDARTYDRMCLIRAVESTDGMTATSARPPWDLLDSITTRIINEVKGINRVVYDLTGKPPATIEME